MRQANSRFDRANILWFFSVKWTLLLLILALLLISVHPAPSNALLINTQVGTLKDGTWVGIQADVAWPEPPSTGGSITAIPVGLTVFQAYPNARFIETGPMKNCFMLYDCEFHPYSSWAVPGFASYVLQIDGSRYLGNGLNYGYRVEQISASGTYTYRTYFCNAGGCNPHYDVNMGVANFPKLWIAAESNGNLILPARVSAAKSKTASVFLDYCYDPLLSFYNVSIPSLAQITACNNYAWQISYAFRTFIPIAIR